MAKSRCAARSIPGKAASGQVVKADFAHQAIWHKQYGTWQRVGHVSEAAALAAAAPSGSVHLTVTPKGSRPDRHLNRSRFEMVYPARASTRKLLAPTIPTKLGIAMMDPDRAEVIREITTWLAALGRYDNTMARQLDQDLRSMIRSGSWMLPPPPAQRVPSQEDDEVSLPEAESVDRHTPTHEVMSALDQHVLPAATLLQLLEHNDSAVHSAVIRSKTPAPVEVTTVLLQNHPQEASTILEHHELGKDEFEFFSNKYADVSARCAIASRSDLPQDYQQSMTKDTSAVVLETLVDNGAVTEEVRHLCRTRLQAIHDSKFAKSLETRNEQEWNELARSEYLTDEQLRRLTRSASKKPKVLEELCRRPELSDNARQILLRSRGRAVFAARADLRPDELLYLLEDKTQMVGNALALRQDLSPEQVAKLLDNVLPVVISNTATNQRLTTQQLADVINDQRVHLDVAKLKLTVENMADLKTRPELVQQLRQHPALEQQSTDREQIEAHVIPKILTHERPLTAAQTKIAIAHYHTWPGSLNSLMTEVAAGKLELPPNVAAAA